MIAGAAEDGGGKRADAACRAGDGDRAEHRRLAVVLHPEQGEGSGETRGAEDHRFAQVQARGQWNGPGRFDARVFAVAAVAGLGQAATRHQHWIAFLERRILRVHDMASHVDAAIEWKTPQDLALAGAGESILVVDRGIRGLDDEVAGREIVQRDGFDAAPVALCIVMDAKGGESGGDRHVSSSEVSWLRRFWSIHLSASAGV